MLILILKLKYNITVKHKNEIELNLIRKLHILKFLVIDLRKKKLKPLYL